MESHQGSGPGQRSHLGQSQTTGDGQRSKHREVGGTADGDPGVRPCCMARGGHEKPPASSPLGRDASRATAPGHWPPLQTLSLDRPSTGRTNPRRAEKLFRNFRGVAAIVAQSELNNDSPVAWAMLIDQLGRTLRAIGDAHEARGEVEMAKVLGGRLSNELASYTTVSRRARLASSCRAKGSTRTAIPTRSGRLLVASLNTTTSTTTTITTITTIRRAMIVASDGECRIGVHQRIPTPPFLEETFLPTCPHQPTTTR